MLFSSRLISTLWGNLGCLALLGVLLVAIGCSQKPVPEKATSSLGPATPLKLVTSKKLLKVISSEDMRNSLKIRTFTVKSNPAYQGATKKYRGFVLQDLLKKYDSALNLKSPFSIQVTTFDGWKAPLYPSKQLIKYSPFLAIQELTETQKPPRSEDGLWSLVKAGDQWLYPGPFYLVWNDGGKNPDIMPLQVETLEILVDQENGSPKERGN